MGGLAKRYDSVGPMRLTGWAAWPSSGQDRWSLHEFRWTNGFMRFFWSNCISSMQSKLSTIAFSISYFAWIFGETSSCEHRGLLRKGGFLRKVHPPSPRSSFCGIPIISGKALAAKVRRPEWKNKWLKVYLSSLILGFFNDPFVFLCWWKICQAPKKVQMTPSFWRICLPKIVSTHQKEVCWVPGVHTHMSRYTYVYIYMYA